MRRCQLEIEGVTIGANTVCFTGEDQKGKKMSTTVFGPKQNLAFWEKVFQTGKAPMGIQILAQPLDLNQMIQARGEGD